MSYSIPQPELKEPKKMQPLFEFVPISYADRCKTSCSVAKPQNVLAHWHLECEIILVLEGNILVGCEGTKYSMEPGDMLLVNARNIHAIDESSEDAVILMVHFDPSVASLAFQATLDPYAFSYRLYPGCGLKDEACQKLRHQLISMALTFFQVPISDGRRLELPGRVLCLMADFFRWNMVEKNNHSGAFSHFELKKTCDLLDFIHNHATEDITVEDAGKLVDMTSRGATELLKKMTGRSFSEYLTNVRLELAKKALIFQDDVSVLDISMKCGFVSLPTFYRIFKKYTGMNPNEFRDTMGSFIYSIYTGGYQVLDQDATLAALTRFSQEFHIAPSP